MSNYSVDFLQEDWDGAGYDFGFACVFDRRNVNQESTTKFVRLVVNTVQRISVRHIAENSPSDWQHITSDAVDAFLGEKFRWEETLLIVLDIKTMGGFSGYVELNQPDQVLVGGDRRHSTLATARVTLPSQRT